jgi:hypothetical protein
VLKMGGRGADSSALVGVAGWLLPVACCAGVPLVGTIVGGLTLAAAIGVAAGLLLATSALAVAGLAFRTRRPGRGRNSPARKVTR